MLTIINAFQQNRNYKNCKILNRGHVDSQQPRDIRVARGMTWASMTWLQHSLIG